MLDEIRHRWILLEVSNLTVFAIYQFARNCSILFFSELRSNYIITKLAHCRTERYTYETCYCVLHCAKSNYMLLHQFKRNTPQPLLAKLDEYKNSTSSHGITMRLIESLQGS